ncbi:MAG: N-acetylmuramoyl-L-alanine amidase [Eubacteriales bacterium]|nr:N-acetylmuramoyl-L-alanine amidase [Eubacteriales bacterium]
MNYPITEEYLTQNPTYARPTRIAPTYVVIHSTATPGVMAASWPARWNKPDVEKSVHYFVDDTAIVAALPEGYWGWHCGKPINSMSVGMEICEPKDWKTDRAYFEAAWARAVWLAARICKRWNIPTGNVLGHCEAYARGLSNSNHADPLHWFPLFGKSMDDFRAALGGGQAAAITPKGIAPALWDTLVRTVAAECRGEPYLGKIAVSQCIRDRRDDSKKRFGKTLEAVLRPGQFAAPWQGDLSTVPEVEQAARAVFEGGERAYPQAVLWFLGARAAAQTVEARDAAWQRLGTVGGHTFWGDERTAAPIKAANPYGVPVITKGHMLRRGSRGDEVRWLQWELEQAGYTVGEAGVDGVFGGDTDAALRAYQADHGLKADGIAGPLTFKMMNG